MRMPTSATGTTSSRSVWQRWSVGIAVTVGMLGIVLFVTMLFGHVDGLEFSPDNFQKRSFHYWEIPLIGIQVYPIQRHNRSSDLEKHLVSSQMISVNGKEKEPAWHLVYVSRGSNQSRHDPAMLCNYFGLTNPETETYWLQWTKDHSQAAKVLWTAVQEVATHHLYIFIPEMFTIAKTTEDADEFKVRLDSLLVEKYSFFGAAALELGQFERAIQLLELGLKRDSQNESLKKTLDIAKQRQATAKSK